MFKRCVLIIALLCLPVYGIAVLPLNYPGAQAQEKEKTDYSNVRTRRVPVLGKKVYERLAEVQKILEEEKSFRRASRVLDQMLKNHNNGREELNGYELANVWNSYGYLYYLQERHEDAIDAYREVIRYPSQIPDALLTNTRYVIAQMFFVTERYDEAIEQLQEWMDSVRNPGPDVWFLLAQAYFQSENKEQALEAANKARNLAERRGTAMRESWWQLLRALYYEQEDYPEVINILRELVKGWPRRQYWVQLAGMYGQQEDGQNQVIAMETASLQDILIKEKEIINAAYLLMGQGMPYEAAKVMESGIEQELVEETSENLELLGSAWQNAQEVERALPILERAADMAEDGDIYARLASAYFDLHRFEDAVRVGESAVDKGEIKRADTLNMVLGMSLFNLKKYKRATMAFEEAGKDERSENLADQWQVHIIREQRRLRQLAKEQEDPTLFDLLRGS